jgi:hypothetical protein
MQGGCQLLLNFTLKRAENGQIENTGQKCEENDFNNLKYFTALNGVSPKY